MIISLPYGQESIHLEVPDRRFIGFMDPRIKDGVDDIEEAISRAIDHPIDSGPLAEMIRPDK